MIWPALVLCWNPSVITYCKTSIWKCLYCMWDWQDVPWGRAMGGQGSAERVCGSPYDCQVCVRGHTKHDLCTSSNCWASRKTTHTQSHIWHFFYIIGLEYENQTCGYAFLQLTNHDQVFRRGVWRLISFWSGSLFVTPAEYDFAAGRSSLPTLRRKTSLEIQECLLMMRLAHTYPGKTWRENIYHEKRITLT